MELEFKADFETTRADWDAFWAGSLGRPAVIAVRPKPGREPARKPHPYRFAFAEDMEALARQVCRWGETHVFLGDAVPSYPVNFGTDHFAALLGAELTWSPDSPDTTWVEPFVQDWDDLELRFNPEGCWWERTVAAIRALREQCHGRLLIDRFDLSGGLDCLAAVRGAGPLLEDLLLVPAKVQRALEQVNRAVDEVCDALAEQLDNAEAGTTNRFGMYCRGRINVSQCDVSCMVSPEMFLEFQMPCLRHEMARHDANCYHLDGPDAVKHLPAVGSIEDLHVVQWRPLHNGRWRESLPVYRQIDQLGKGHVFQTFLQLDIPGAEELCRELSSPLKVLDASRLPVDDVRGFAERLGGMGRP
jgi:5-methyltetrahydrofolate--homocysteine methyltransferase